MIDKNQVFSSSNDWATAVNADVALWAEISKSSNKGWGYVSEYAKKHVQEDFAESISAYICNHESFKSSYPNRAALIRRIAQMLSK